MLKKKTPQQPPIKNVENINALANFIEEGKYTFNMQSSFAKPACGTAGCIGGHASVLWPDVQDDICSVETKGMTITWDGKKLKKKLGISDNQYEEMCYCGLSNTGLNEIDRTRAVKYLRSLAHFNGRGSLRWGQE